MATLVKEKKREKKRSKEKATKHKEVDLDNIVEKDNPEVVLPGSSKHEEVRLAEQIQEKQEETVEVQENASGSMENTKQNETEVLQDLAGPSPLIQESTVPDSKTISDTIPKDSVPNSKENATDTYKYLTARLTNLGLVREVTDNTQLQEEIPSRIYEVKESCDDVVVPSAPMFVEAAPSAPLAEAPEEIAVIKPKVKCMPLEEAMRIFGGNEMAAVKAMSEREEAIVQAGPVSSVDHPLVDLLSTFRTSLMALERERGNITKSFNDEENYRSTLWKVEKRFINMKEECPCGTQVELKASYEYAELLRDKLPVAKMKLEALLKDVQESYCHHQHAVLLAHCQIEELISEIIGSNKHAIREALSLILQALRTCDGAPEVLPNALQRWAGFLAEALVSSSDLSQLLFLIHHLFRQSRSVIWAERVMRVPMVDRLDAARAVALLHTLLDNTKLEAAHECTEDVSEEWEELSLRGGGAVSEGSLRETDLLALVDALPLGMMLARILGVRDANPVQCSPAAWRDPSGGSCVLAASAGVRCVLAAVSAARPHYRALRARLQRLAAVALAALAAYYYNNIPYDRNFNDKLVSELEACFAAGFTFFGAQNLHKLPTSLLSEDTAREYCFAFIIGLHDDIPKTIESLSIVVPVLPCALRVRIVAHAAANRQTDIDLARIVMEFLIQTGIKRKSESCKGECEAAARDSIPVILDAHPGLHASALHTVASLSEVETVDPSCVTALCVHKWRPSDSELVLVLDDWKARCPTLVSSLLLALDYTPYTGLPLAAQRALCGWVWWVEAPPWPLVLALRPHADWWRAAPPPAPPAPPPGEPKDLFQKALAIIAFDWGHSVPLICSQGISVLLELVKERPEEAVQCAAPLMCSMRAAPESLLHTDKFREFFETLSSVGPSLVQRALRRGGASGLDLLCRLVYAHLKDTEPVSPDGAALPCWLAALAGAPGAARALDLATVLTRDWATVDMHVTYCLQENKIPDLVQLAVSLSPTAPFFSECVLRARSGLDMQSGLFASLNTALDKQRTMRQRIHVDNALQQLKAPISADELPIYRSAAAAAAAAPAHPAHLYLWTLFTNLYLHRPPDMFHESIPPVGPLYFSGLVKTRMMHQIKKKLQETITYHHNEAETLKSSINNNTSNQKPSNVKKSESITFDKDLLPTLTIFDLTGEAKESSDSDESVAEVSSSENVDSCASGQQYDLKMLNYHVSAKRMLSDYHTWFEQGDKAKAMPHNADVSRYIGEDMMSEAWRRAVQSRVPTNWEQYSQPMPQTIQPTMIDPVKEALDAIHSIQNEYKLRTRRTIKSPLEDISSSDSRALIYVLDKKLNEMCDMAREWSTEVATVSSLNSKLWEMVSSLRVPRPLPPVKKQCPNKCKDIVFLITEREWCLSTSSERGIKENRSSARIGIRKIARARPHTARTAALLQTIARRVNSRECSVRALESCWAAAARLAASPAAADAVTTLFNHLVERWLISEGAVCAALVRRWCVRGSAALQRALCGALVSPRRLACPLWRGLYDALLGAHLPPHTMFSYLSKFEVPRWSRAVSEDDRRSILTTMVEACLKFSANPQYITADELVCSHVRSMCGPQALSCVLLKVSRAAALTHKPAALWPHLIVCAKEHAHYMAFDELGHLLRSLGEVWSSSPVTSLTPHASLVTSLLTVLVRAFVTAAIALTYEPERVGWYAWGASIEAWTPWLKSCTDDDTVKAFVRCLQHIMMDCPGSEIKVLQQCFEWTLTSAAAPALLTELLQLPWEHHQWFYGSCLQVLAQKCESVSPTLRSWMCQVSSTGAGPTLLRDVPPDAVPLHLAHLLYIFTGTTIRYHDKLIEETKHLPWNRLSEPALGEALDRFFAVNHDPSTAYHDLPQFRVLLSASELSPPSPPSPHLPPCPKRGRMISSWSCAGAVHSLAPVYKQHAKAVLTVIENVAPLISESEVMELLVRAMVILCLEPAGTVALPVWCDWIRNTSPVCTRNAAAVSASLTAPAHVHTLADVAVRALMDSCEEGWHFIQLAWRSSPWRCDKFCNSGAWAAAYGSLVTHHAPLTTRPYIVAFNNCKHNFVEDEIIIAVWICYVCRAARDCLAAGAAKEAIDGTAIDAVAAINQTATTDQTATTNQTATYPSAASFESSSSAEETLHAAKTLFSCWAQQPRRSILSVVTLKSDTGSPTVKHRLLCRLALCYTSPSPDNVSSFSSAAAAAPGCGDVTPWGSAPTLGKVVRLAKRLYPSYDKYFSVEWSFCGEG